MTSGVRLIVAYDGTAFAGYAQQPGQRTVQGVLQEAAERICGHAVRVRGASRTDAGVHARGQVVAFDTERELAPVRWALALNRYLPDDVAVRRAEACEPGYEPRFDALHKTYRYALHVGELRDPLHLHRAWFLGKLLRGSKQRGQLDLAAMRSAAQTLLGTHDFKAFRSADDERQNTIRTIHALELIEGYAGEPEIVALEVRGSAFMKNMVRILTGTLVEIGLGRMPAAAMADLLAPTATRAQAGDTAPAHGLTLVQVTLGRLAQASPKAP